MTKRFSFDSIAQTERCTLGAGQRIDDPTGRRVYDYEAGLLSDEAAYEFEVHLIRCRACQRIIENLAHLAVLAAEFRDEIFPESKSKTDPPSQMIPVDSLASSDSFSSQTYTPTAGKPAAGRVESLKTNQVSLKRTFSSSSLEPPRSSFDRVAGSEAIEGKKADDAPAMEAVSPPNERPTLNSLSAESINIAQNTTARASPPRDPAIGGKPSAVFKFDPHSQTLFLDDSCLPPGPDSNTAPTSQRRAGEGHYPLLGELACTGLLAEAVKVTLGPKGRNVVIAKKFGPPVLAKDGIAVAQEIELDGRFEVAGDQIVLEVVSKTESLVGDGTATAVVLAEMLFFDIVKAASAGADPRALERGVVKALERAVEEIRKLSRPVRANTIALIGTTHVDGDVELGGLIADAIGKAGPDGTITIESSGAFETYVEAGVAMKFKSGFLSRDFVTDPKRMEAVLEDAFILIYEDKVSSITPLLPLLKQVAKLRRPLLIISEVESAALATLVVNKLRGTLDVCAVRAPEFGENRRAMLHEIAALTGGKAITRDLGTKLEYIRLGDLGRGKRVVVGEDHTAIVGIGSETECFAKQAQARASRPYDGEVYVKATRKLIDSVVAINVGAASESELIGKKARIEKALRATRAALEEGVVPGGGVAFIRAQKALKSFRCKNEDENLGVSIVRRALELPLRQIILNAGKKDAVILAKVRNGRGSFGYNAVTDRFGDLMKMGVVDPTKLVRCVLQTAGSVVLKKLRQEYVKPGVNDYETQPARSDGQESSLKVVNGGQSQGTDSDPS
jgi:chaperonin GroEL